jgi:hypothetical protein
MLVFLSPSGCGVHDPAPRPASSTSSPRDDLWAVIQALLPSPPRGGLRRAAGLCAFMLEAAQIHREERNTSKEQGQSSRAGEEWLDRAAAVLPMVGSMTEPELQRAVAALAAEANAITAAVTGAADQVPRVDRQGPADTSVAGLLGSWGPRSPPSWATSVASPRRRSCAATPGCARGSTSPAAGTSAARWPRTGPPTCGGRWSRPPPTPPATPAPATTTSGPSSGSAASAASRRPRRGRPQARRGLLAHAHRTAAVRAGKAPRPGCGRPTTLD